MRILVDDNPETIAAVDKRGFTPLHFALGHADRAESPGIVGLLLSRSPAAANMVDAQDNLPVHQLAVSARTLLKDERVKRVNCEECLGRYLAARPAATVELLMAVQLLPGWLRGVAVQNPVLQNILNVKISQRLPTLFLIVDFTCYVSVGLLVYPLAVTHSVLNRRNELPPPHMAWLPLKSCLAILYLAAAWLLFREILQAFSLARMGLFKTW